MWRSLKVKVYGSSKGASSFRDFETFKRIEAGSGAGAGVGADSTGALNGMPPGTKRKDKTKTTTSPTTTTPAIKVVPNGDVPSAHGSESLPN